MLGGMMPDWVEGPRHGVCHQSWIRKTIVYLELDVKPQNFTLGPPTVSGQVTMVRTANHNKTGYRNVTRLIRISLSLYFVLYLIETPT